MTIIEAWGISMPTSMTGVATRMSVSLLAKRLIISCLSLILIFPWIRSSFNLGKILVLRCWNSTVAALTWARDSDEDSSISGQTINA